MQGSTMDYDVANTWLLDSWENIGPTVARHRCGGFDSNFMRYLCFLGNYMVHNESNVYQKVDKYG